MELTQAQRELLRTIPDQHPIDRIDRVWIFPPHNVRNVEMGLLVLSILSPDPDAGDQRVLYTVRYQVDRSEKGGKMAKQVEEEGRAPPERIDRVIEGVARRGGTQDGEPVVLEIGADIDRWTELTSAVLAQGATG